jgi:hypothetical protein
LEATEAVAGLRNGFDAYVDRFFELVADRADCRDEGLYARLDIAGAPAFVLCWNPWESAEPVRMGAAALVSSTSLREAMEEFFSSLNATYREHNK